MQEHVESVVPDAIRGDKDTLTASLDRIQHTSMRFISVILDDGETVGIQ